MIRKISFRAMSIALAVIIICLSTSVSFSVLAATTTKKTFDDVTISILGDSISTFENYSNGDAAKTTNTTIKDYPAHYVNNRYGLPVDGTWWKQAADEIGAKILVNNSYSGSKIFYPGSSSSSLGYLNRATALHDNTGENAGQKPDIIAVYLGTNDFTHCMDSIGRASDIDYETLIRKTGASYSYATAETTVEAYAIMIHKMKQAYPDAEIYCFTILPRFDLTSTEKNTLKSFNNSIKTIAKHFKCYVADLYTYSGINFKKENIEKYIGDVYLHPNEYGMDAIANCFLSSLYKNSKYLPEGETVYNVNYVLNDNVAITEGTKTAALGGKPFSCSLSKLVYGITDVTVTMAGEDITDSCYVNGHIEIPSVTGDIDITISYTEANRSFDSYRWEIAPIDNAPEEDTEPEVTEPEITEPEITEPEVTEPEITEPEVTEPEVTEPETSEPTTDITEDELITDTIDPALYLNGLVCNDIINVVENENTENKLHNITGIIENGEVSQGEFVFHKEIELFYDKPWSLVWSAEYTSPSSSHIVFSANETAQTEGNLLIHIQKGTSVLAIAEYKDGKYHNLGIDLTAHGIYLQDTHTYKLVNIPGIAGTNTIQLYVDGVKIGSLTKYYIDDTYIGTNKSLFYYKDFILKHVGTTDEPVNKCILNYIQVWEDNVPSTHVHDYLYHTETSATCTVDGTLNSLCDCGYAQQTVIQKHFGHSAIDWVVTKVATVNAQGLMQRICTRCNKVVESKIIAQKKCGTPKLSSAKNAEKGVLVTWKKTEGADSYRLYRKEKDGKWAYIKASTETSTTDTTAKNGKTYYYTVRAVNEAGNSSYNTTGVGVKHITAPKLKSISNSASGITVSWSKIGGAKYYRVYRLNSKGAWELVKQTTSTSFTDKKVSNGHTYTYTVKAFGTSCTSGFVTAGIKMERLSSPKLVSATSSKTGIKFKWGAISGADGYYVYRKQGKGSWVKIATAKGKATTTYTDTSAKKGKTYYYTVKAYSGNYSGCYNTKGIKGVRK